MGKRTYQQIGQNGYDIKTHRDKDSDRCADMQMNKTSMIKPDLLLSDNFFNHPKMTERISDVALAVPVIIILHRRCYGSACFHGPGYNRMHIINKKTDCYRSAVILVRTNIRRMP